MMCLSHINVFLSPSLPLSPPSSKKKKKVKLSNDLSCVMPAFLSEKKLGWSNCLPTSRVREGFAVSAGFWVDVLMHNASCGAQLSDPRSSGNLNGRRGRG